MPWVSLPRFGVLGCQGLRCPGVAAIRGLAGRKSQSACIVDACRGHRKPQTEYMAEAHTLLTRHSSLLPWLGLHQGEALDADGGSRPLALYSRPVSSTSAARYSGAQLVGWTWRAASYDAVWQVRGVCVWGGGSG
jgi:hypothetical protein